MGADFNFTEWCDTWLKTSGVNILEPVVEYNEDGSVKSFAIKQSLDLRGKNRLRKQKLNVAFYDHNFNAHVIKDIVISERTELNPVEFEYKGPVSAIIINFDEHAYSKVRFDQRTIDTLEKSLSKIDDFLARSMIWRQLWIHVIDCKMSSIQFVNFVIN
jgi:aminopeptidase N